MFMYFVPILLIQISSQIVEAEIRTFHLLEEIEAGTKIVNLAKLFSITKTDDSILKITDNQANGIDYFDIDLKTMNLIIRKSPDRDTICPNIQKSRINHVNNPSQCIIPLLILHGRKDEPSYNQISIEILDINDNKPTFPMKTFVVNIPENNNNDNHNRQPLIRLPEAVDLDSGENGVKTYRLQGKDAVNFKIEVDNKGPHLGLLEKLDREVRDKYSLKLLAKDGGVPSRTGTLNIEVKVEDVNDNKPKFERDSYKINIAEDYVVDSKVTTIHATDSDIGDNGRIGFRFSDTSNPMEKLASQLFKIQILNDTTANLLVANQIDCKQLRDNKIEFFIDAFDYGNPSLINNILVEIKVNDINNNPPEIFVHYLDEKHGKVGRLTENTVRDMIAEITVKDADRSVGNDISCKTNDSRFYLDEIPILQTFASQYPVRMYKLFNNVQLDREKAEIVKFQLICLDNIHQRSSSRVFDSSSNHYIPRIVQLTSSETITVLILDKNDETPIFKEKLVTFYLPENLPTQRMMDNGESYKLGYLKAVDKDVNENAKIEYKILVNNANSFVIDKDTGKLSAIRSYDRENLNQLSLTIVATDCPKRDIVRKSSSVTVRVVITDINDCIPKFLEHSYHFGVLENVQHAILGTVVAKDDDEGQNGQIKYKLAKVTPGQAESDLRFSHRNNFYIDPNTGKIRIRNRLDREICDHYDLVVHAIDNPNQIPQPSSRMSQRSSSNIQNTATTLVSITVLDQNDNRPRITSPTNNQEFYIDPDQSTAGHPIFTIQAQDSDYGKNSTVQYEIQYGNTDLFNLDRGAGLCFLRKTLTDRHPRSFSLQLKAYDLGTPVSLNSSVNIKIIRSFGRKNQVNYPINEGNSKTNRFNGDQDRHSSSSIFFSSFSVSDRTLVVILTTIFILLILITTLLVAFIRYRRILLRHFQKKSRDYSQGTVLQNYGKGKCMDEFEDIRNNEENEKYHNIFPGATNATASVLHNNESKEHNTKFNNMLDSGTGGRRSQLCGGYNEYGTLIHPRSGQTYYNRNLSKYDPEYQTLGYVAAERVDNYQLPSSHVIINEGPHQQSSIIPLSTKLQRRNLIGSPDQSHVISNMSPSIVSPSSPTSCISPTAGVGSFVTTNTVAIISTPTLRTNSLDCAPQEPLIQPTSSSISDNYRELKFSSATTENQKSFVMKNMKAVDNSPRKSSVFGSFV